MLHKQPSWTLDRPAGTRAWPDRVRLEGRFLLGQWYCLNRGDGSMVWERSLPGVNFITGVHDGTILCATIEPEWTSGAGACAVRLADGEVLWSAALSPVSLEGSTFLCQDGAVRDLRTACLIRQQPALQKYAAQKANCCGSLGLALMLSHLRGRGPLELAAGIFVAGQLTDGDYTATARDGRPLWLYSPEEAGWYCGQSRGERFVAPPYIYLLASRTPPYRYVEEPKIREQVPTRRYLLALDVRPGKLVQEIDLGVWKGHCAIDDVDEDGAILSFEKVRLAYHRRQAADA